MRGLLNETYLNDLCEHLAVRPPTRGTWLDRARGWSAPPGDRRHGAWLRIVTTPHILYQVAVEAEVPLPAHTRDAHPLQLVAEENAIATTLAVYAALMPTAPGGEAHLAGGPSIGTIIGTSTKRGPAHEVTARATIREIARSGRPAMSRLVHDAGRARGSRVDLRTVVAVAFGIAGSQRPQRLTTNPTGHWPNALDTEQQVWEPATEVIGDFTAAAR
ncbi:hypothetical protein [Kitasatospora cheerisanensis]|uniref:Uncharacterized protein n=1 Tax=Kitasatospora cheerisanensis KCTC 2395 TaxID=1348663 RepID=A0A066YVN6_9ACTN|nr:hypothetical protein [Kitasatospora cheerisanensis]KDN85603.1 hypothetical protein KCH_26200 [Kitasatospora cheerisanensis KCTC 2395]